MKNFEKKAQCRKTKRRILWAQNVFFLSEIKLLTNKKIGHFGGLKICERRKATIIIAFYFEKRRLKI